MSDLARLLQELYGEQPNALPQYGETYDASNVLAGMPKKNALADALRVAGAPTKDEHGFLFSNVGGELKFNPWEAVKGFMSYRAPPGALSTSGDDAPVRNSTDAAGWLGLSGLGLNFAGQVPKNALGIFGGRLAKTADHNALAKAEEMAAKGADRKDIWDQTGWFQGADGKWRFEIDDSKARWATGGGDGEKLPAHLAHDELFSAYPSAKDVKVYRDGDFGEGGWFGALGAGYPQEPGMLVSPSASNPKLTALHEMQHAVQRAEGFSEGANPHQFHGSANPMQAYRDAPGEVEARMVEARQKLSADERRRLPPWQTK